MKNKPLFILILLGILFTVSCSKHELEETTLPKETQQAFIETRGAQSIQLWSDEAPVRPTMATNPLLDELGAGYDILKSFPLVSPSNITYMVVDVDKLYAENKSRINVKKNYTSLSDFVSFSNAREYTESKNHKFDFGLNVNAKFLRMLDVSIDASLKKIYNHSNTETNRTIYSEIELGITTKDLSLNMGSPQQLAEKYTTESFKFDTYNLSPEALVNNYGGHILTNYTLGGRAFAVTKAETKYNESSENKSRKMSAAVKTTFKTILNKSQAGFNTDVFDSTAINIKEDFSFFEMSLRTYGGNPGYGIAGSISIQDPQTVNIDLKNWGLSVVDDRFAQIHTIQPKGLTPIYNFIREENIRKRVKDYMEYGTNPEFYEPRIDRFVLNSMVYTVLYTRMGNTFLLDKQKFDGSYNWDEVVTLNWWIKNEYPFSVYPFFSIKDRNDGIPVRYYPEGNYPNEYCGPLISLSGGFGAVINFDFRNLPTNAIKLCKIAGDASNMVYVTIRKENKVYALGIYADFIKTLYAIDAENLPVETIKDLTGYTVVGL